MVKKESIVKVKRLHFFFILPPKGRWGGGGGSRGGKKHNVCESKQNVMKFF